MTNSVSPLQHQRLYERVADQLMNMLMDGELLPGDKLVAEEIAGKLGVSRMPVRDALNYMESIGVVEKVPYTGCTVTKLSKQDIWEIYTMRQALEPLVGYYACLKISDQEIEQVQEVQNKIEELLARGDVKPKELFLLNREFHFSIFRTSGMTCVCNIIEVLWGRLALSKIIYERTYAADPAEAQRLNQDHRTFLNHLKQRNAEGLRESIRESLEKKVAMVPDTVFEFYDKKRH